MSCLIVVCLCYWWLLFVVRCCLMCVECCRVACLFAVFVVCCLLKLFVCCLCVFVVVVFSRGLLFDVVVVVCSCWNL